MKVQASVKARCESARIRRSGSISVICENPSQANRDRSEDDHGQSRRINTGRATSGLLACRTHITA